MKKLLLLMLCLTMTVSFVACDPGSDEPSTETPDDSGNTNTPDKPNDEPNDPDNPDDPDEPINGGNSSLTPGEHKQKLEDISLEFVNSFDVSDVQEISDTLWELVDYLEEGDFPEYYSEMMQNIARGVKNMSIAEFKKFTTRASEDFVIDINDPDFNPYAGHSYTYDDYEWIKGSIDKNSIKFIWDNSEALLKWDDTNKFEYDFKEEETNYIVYVPKTITFSLKIDGDEHISVKINTNITDIKTLAPSVEVKINGGYEVKFSSDANNKGIEAASSIKKDGKSICSATSVVAINDATDIDNWFDSYYCDWCEEYHSDLSGEYAIDNVKTGKAQLDILNLSIIIEGDFKGMYEKIEDYEDEYYWYDDNYDYNPAKYKKYCEAVCKLVNEKVKITLVYNDTKEKVADIVMQVTSYDDDYYDKNYEMEPILLFPDESKYAFEDYFTERAFGDLIDRIEEIAEEIEDMDIM